LSDFDLMCVGAKFRSDRTLISIVF
jgi:hypothetical protein